MWQGWGGTVHSTSVAKDVARVGWHSEAGRHNSALSTHSQAGSIELGGGKLQLGVGRRGCGVGQEIGLVVSKGG